jgi:uncharacterized membrane protein
MDSIDLLLICSLSFLSVFFLLSLLAIVMHLITHFLPHVEGESDTSLYAAIAAGVAQQYPNRKIAKIEEL